MIVLQRDQCKPVVDPSEAQLLQHLRRLKVAGKSQFLVLSNIEGDWLQIAGGSLCCIIEWYSKEAQCLSRAYRAQALWLFRDVHKFGLRYGERLMQPDEMLRMAEAEEIALAFRAGYDVTQYFSWRPVFFGAEAARAFGFRDLES